MADFDPFRASEDPPLSPDHHHSEHPPPLALPDNDHPPPSLDGEHLPPLALQDNDCPHSSLDFGHPLVSRVPDAQMLPETQSEDTARASFEQEIAERLNIKEEEMLVQFEQQIAEINTLWEAKLETCLKNCYTEVAEKHSLEIEQLKIVHSEEVENALKTNTIVYQAQIEALKELHQEGYDALMHECNLLRKQLAEQTMETQVSDCQLQHIEEMERVLEDVEQSKKASDTEKEAEIGLLRDRIEELEEQLKLSSPENVEASNKQALQEKELELQAHFEAQLALMKAETKNKVRIECESKVRSLKLELEQLQQHCEQQLLETGIIHAKEIENLQKQHLRKENELIHTHEEQMKELTQSHKVELSNTRSQSEVSNTLSAQSEPRLKVFSSPRPLSAGHNQLPQSHSKVEDDLVDVVQSESTLLTDSPSKIEQIRDRFLQQRERALSKSREMSPTPLSPRRRPARSSSPSKRKLDYELKLANLEGKMAAERKTQVNLLKEKHERDLAEIEKKRKKERAEIRVKLRAQLQDEHSQKTKQAVADCLAEGDQKLIDARKEIEHSHQKQISQLQSAHQTEMAMAETDHNAKIEALATKYKDELSKLVSMNLGATQEQHTEALEAQALQHKFEIESLQAQFQSEQEGKINELREKLKQECIGKFKVMADKLQQIHQEEVNTIKQEASKLSLTHEDNLQLLREELEAEHERKMVTALEEHKSEMKTLCEGYEEQLRLAETDHANRVRTISAQQDDQSEQLELTVRYVYVPNVTFCHTLYLSS